MMSLFQLFQWSTIILVPLIFQTDQKSKIITWPAPAEINPSVYYHVYANNENVFVYDSPIASYAMFDFEGTVNITIKAARDIKWVDIRPKSLDIKPEFRDSTIHFTLTKSCSLSIELNGEFSNQPLFLFAGKPEIQVPDKNNKNVIWFEGAKIHKPGIIEIKSGQTVYMEGGAVVEGIIHAENASDIKILGRGILDGTTNNEIRGESRYRFIHLQNCKNITIEGIVLEDSHSWQIVPINCDNVSIRNTKILSDNGGDDGIDLVRSRNVKVENCFVRTKDDCIAIKTTYDYPPEANSENIEVTGCVFWNAAWGNGLEIGFELRSDYVRNVTFKDCDVIHVEDGAVLSIHNGDRSTVQDIRFENIRVEDARQKLFDVAIFLSRYSVDRPSDPEERTRRYLNGAWDGVLSVTPENKAFHSQYRGHIRNVIFKDIYLTDGLLPFSIFCGFDEEHQVENVTIDNLVVHGKKITTLEEAKVHQEFTKNLQIR
jgi:hypothetical protein